MHDSLDEAINEARAMGYPVVDILDDGPLYDSWKIYETQDDQDAKCVEIWGQRMTEDTAGGHAATCRTGDDPRDLIW